MEISANFIKTVFGVLFASIGSGATFLIGEWSQLHSILVAMMVLDFLTGLMKGAYNKKLSSKVGYKGLLRKGGIVVAIIVANLADMIIGSETPVFVVAVTLFYVAIEALSLIENLEAIGLPMPQKFKEFFTQMRSENEGKEEKEKDLYFHEDTVEDPNAISDSENDSNATTSEKSEK